MKNLTIVNTFWVSMRTLPTTALSQEGIRFSNFHNVTGKILLCQELPKPLYLVIGDHLLSFPSNTTLHQFLSFVNPLIWKNFTMPRIAKASLEALFGRTFIGYIPLPFTAWKEVKHNYYLKRNCYKNHVTKFK